MRLVFVGPPGSGKGTQARLLQERLNLTHISTGDLLRRAVKEHTPAGQRAESYMRKGQLVPDEVVMELVADLFHGPDAPDNFVLDGFPRNQAQAEWLDGLLTGCGHAIERTVLFHVPDEELIARIAGRAQAEGRADDNAETVAKRLAVYHATTEPVVDHYRRAGLLVEIPATGDVETIHRQVVKLIG